MQRFYLLMMTMGVQGNIDTQEQSESSSRLTKLAFFYAPLSFVTSIFGMNMDIINDEHPSLAIFFILLAAVSATTLCIVLGSRCVGSIKQRRAVVMKQDGPILHAKRLWRDVPLQTGQMLHGAFDRLTARVPRRGRREMASDGAGSVTLGAYDV